MSPPSPGCVLDVRIIGVIKGEDELLDGGSQRDDRLLAVAKASHTFENIQSVEELPEQLRIGMEEFFVTYPRLLSGKTYKLLDTKGPQEASMLIQKARRNV